METETRNIGEASVAEQACAYIIDRVCQSADFAYYMLGTECLARCFAAEAQRRGITDEEVRAWFNERRGMYHPHLVRNGESVARVNVLRMRLEAIEQYIDELDERGDLPIEMRERLTDMLYADHQPAA